MSDLQKNSDLCKLSRCAGLLLFYARTPPDLLTSFLDPALAVACRDIDVRNVKALIIGPHETPYEFGFFEVRPPFLSKSV